MNVILTLDESTNKIFDKELLEHNIKIEEGHIGTHLDRFEKSTIPDEYFKSRGIIFNVIGKKEITLDDIDLSLINKGDFVIFRSGRLEKYSYVSDEYFKDFPYLSNDVINMLIDKQVRFIGIDSPKIRPIDEHEIVCKICERHGVYIVLNLDKLDKITSQTFNIYINWKINKELTGAKCDVIAEIK